METSGVKNGKVSTTAFTSVIGVIVIALGWLFISLAQANDRGQDTKNDVGDIKVLMAEIKTDVVWIKEALNSNPTIIKK